MTGAGLSPGVSESSPEIGSVDFDASALLGGLILRRGMRVLTAEELLAELPR